MKIKINSDDNFPLNLFTITIAIIISLKCIRKDVFKKKLKKINKTFHI